MKLETGLNVSLLNVDDTFLLTMQLEKNEIHLQQLFSPRLRGMKSPIQK